MAFSKVRFFCQSYDSIPTPMHPVIGSGMSDQSFSVRQKKQLQSLLTRKNKFDIILVGLVFWQKETNNCPTFTICLVWNNLFCFLLFASLCIISTGRLDRVGARMGGRFMQKAAKRQQCKNCNLLGRVKSCYTPSCTSSLKKSDTSIQLPKSSRVGCGCNFPRWQIWSRGGMSLPSQSNDSLKLTYIWCPANNEEQKKGTVGKSDPPCLRWKESLQSFIEYNLQCCPPIAIHPKMSNICSGAKIKIEHFKKQYIESSCYNRYLVLTKTSGQNKTSSNHTVGILHSEACILLFLCKNHNRKQQKLHANELMREKGAGDDWEEELYKESEMQLYIPVDTHTAILKARLV